MPSTMETTNSARPAKRRRVVLNSTDDLPDAAKTTGGAGAGATPAASKDGGAVDSLDLSSFLNSLQREIKDLHMSVKASKDSRMEKAFQRLPRSMRRRTASHNAKRLPRRLRQQARRDQAADNTPSVAAGLAKRRSARPASAWVYEKTKQRVKRQQEKKLAALQAAVTGGEDNDDEDGDHESEGHEDDDPMDVDDSHANGNGNGNGPLPNNPLPVDKLKLPTHMWLAKRAHMASPSPLWHAVVAKTPANKTYRSSLRSAGLRSDMCLCWDTSYMATIQLTGPAEQLGAALASIVEPHLLTAPLRSGASCVDVKLPRSFLYQQQPQQEGEEGQKATCGELGGPGNCGAMTVFYNPAADPVNNGGDSDDKDSRAAFLRVHPVLFSLVWKTLAEAVEQNQLAVELRDFRMEVGSIDVTGSSAVDALQAILRPHFKDGKDSKDSKDSEDKKTPAIDPQAADFLQLRHLDTTGLAPASGAMLAFDVQDPRLDEPDELAALASSGSVMPGQQALADWPSTRCGRPSGLFDAARRQQATQLASQASLDRRRGKLIEGRKLLATPESHPIPVILAVVGAAVPAASASAVPATSVALASLRSRRPSGMTTPVSTTWTLLAPRGCIDVLWRRLHQHCLSRSGKRPLFGGLDEERFVALERGRPWFPVDFPGTTSGWDTELQSRCDGQAAWDKKPPSKRPQWTALDLGGRRSSSSGSSGSGSIRPKGEIGSGFACDWEHLFGVPSVSLAATPDKPSTAEARFAALCPAAMPDIVRTMHHVTWADVRAAVAAARRLQPLRQPQWHTPYPLLTVSLEMLGRGVPLARARIYRLPASTGGDGPLRQQWIALAGTANTLNNQPHTKHANHKQHKKQLKRMPPGADLATRKTLLARSLLEVELPYPRPDEGPQLPLPDDADLIGFVTSGAHRFHTGRGFGIGHVSAQKLVDAVVAEDGDDNNKNNNDANAQNARPVPARLGKDARLCIVRNAGERVGWLARWTAISS